MSKLIVPSYLKGKIEDKKEENKEPAMDRVPKATGWRIVVLPHKGIEKTKADRDWETINLLIFVHLF